MSRHLAFFLRRIYKLSVQKLENSAVSRLMQKMADCTTCNSERFSKEPPKTEEENGGLKRSLNDDNTTDNAGNKIMKTEPGEKVADDEKDEKTAVLPRKKKCALLLSYCGAGYNGMQINPGVKTIEQELVNALYKAEAITEDGKANMGKNLLPKINEHLQPEIRVLAMKRTTRGFDAKGNCSARTYEYLTPTFAFAKDYQSTTKYRVTEEKIAEVNDVLSKFVGTRNYHNFTSGKHLYCCLKVDIPKAPAVGLVLDEVHFDAYNRRYGSDGLHEALEWDENEEEIQKFKHQYIYKQIIDTEAREHSMMKWLRSLPDHTYTDERMEEIGTKKDGNNAKQNTTADANNTLPHDNSGNQGGSGDAKQLTEGEDIDKKEDAEASGIQG
ncbi:tRNA pseudouridine synthase A, mitochondrial [Stylophora pistillata]|uniref:tRNA pseudouridine synthase A, mitochondrial n=1 Tax=Stylophora pistillata TaxID=50429 RepID=A0A2B4RGG8_STYPI|nr:tRNA pseudouridine synthase A, mitochondrial [Stylophora pistillata]